MGPPATGVLEDHKVHSHIKHVIKSMTFVRRHVRTTGVEMHGHSCKGAGVSKSVNFKIVENRWELGGRDSHRHIFIELDMHINSIAIRIVYRQTRTDTLQN